MKIFLQLVSGILFMIVLSIYLFVVINTNSERLFPLILTTIVMIYFVISKKRAYSLYKSGEKDKAIFNDIGISLLVIMLLTFSCIVGLSY